MEARRAFVGSKSYKQLWIILAALLCAAMLAVGAAVIGSGAISTGASKAPVVTHPAPGTVLRQDPASGPSVSSPAKHARTQF